MIINFFTKKNNTKVDENQFFSVELKMNNSNFLIDQ